MEKPGKGPLFTRETFTFLKELAQHNDRAWFLKNKARYEQSIRDASLNFLVAIEPGLREISRELAVDPRPVGGSMMRIYRDLRFAKDKRPYRTSIGLHVFHGSSRDDEHLPSYFLHVEPGSSAVYAGVWRPESARAQAIRAAIVAQPARWKRAVAKIRLEGEWYQRPPAGVDPHHPLLDDLRRKDFVSSVEFPDTAVAGPGFVRRFLEACRQGAPLNQFLSNAIGVPW